MKTPEKIDNSILEKLPQDYNNWDIDFLIDYIVNKHHKFVVQENPIVFELTQKAAKLNSDKYPELIEIADFFMEIMGELNCHMMKEENMLFPYIKALVNSKATNTKINTSEYGSVQVPINMMEHEHSLVIDMFEQIKQLSNNYTAPLNTESNCKLAFTKLKEYEIDLHHHIFLENNILFPKAIQLEIELLG